MADTNQTQKEKLMSDMKLVIADAEELLKMTAGQVGERASDMRLRMQARIDQAKSDLVAVQEAAAVKVKDAGRAADSYVQESPWRAVGIAAGVGLVVGLLIGRR